MIEFKLYPKVGDLIAHYAEILDDENAVAVLNTDVHSRDDAYVLSRFVLAVVECIAKDMEDKTLVLGSTDNTSIIPDIDYEVNLYLARKEMEDVWDEVCNSG